MFKFLHNFKMAAIDTLECEFVEHFPFVIAYERHLGLRLTKLQLHLEVLQNVLLFMRIGSIKN